VGAFNRIPKQRHKMLSAQFNSQMEHFNGDGEMAIQMPWECGMHDNEEKNVKDGYLIMNRYEAANLTCRLFLFSFSSRG